MYSQVTIYPPEHSKSKWKTNEWFGNGLMEYTRSFFHHVSKNIGVHSCEFFTLHIVVEGEGTFFIDKHCYDVAPGSILITPPNVRHGCCTNDKMNIFHSLIKCEFFEQYEYELKNLPGYTILFEIEPFLRNETDEPQCQMLYEEDFEKIVPCLHNLVKLEQITYKGREILKNIQLLLLIGMLSSSVNNIHSYKRRTISDYVAMDIVRSMEYIRMNSSKKISIDELAHRTNMSRSTYLRYFKKISGRSPINFLTLCRITHAKKLLCYTKKSISDISQECGFFDSSHFNRVFTLNEGMNPTDFRTLYSNEAKYSVCTLCIRRSNP